MSGGGGVLIVIPCLNEERHLPRLLDQLTRDNPDALIVVADGGSTDRSRAIVSDQAVRGHVILLDNPARLQSFGVNLAVANYGGGRDWLVRVDAHCEYPRDYVAKLLAAAVEHGAQSVVVPMVTRGRSCFQVAAAAAQNSILGTGGSAHRHVCQGAFVDHGHHALMEVDAFRSAGGYRDDMAANEDAELDVRLRKAGSRIWLEPSAAIIYEPRETPAQLWRQYFKYGTGRARTVTLHRTRPKLRQLLPLAVPGAMLLAFLAPLNGWFAAPLVAWLAVSLGGGILIGMREKRLCAGLSGVAAGIMHLAWGLGFISGFFRRP